MKSEVSARLLDKVVPLRQRRGDEDGLARLGPTARREHALERCARLRRTQRRVDFVHHQRAQRACAGREVGRGGERWGDAGEIGASR